MPKKFQITTREGRIVERDENPDGTVPLNNGDSYHVPMMMMDSLQHSISEDAKKRRRGTSYDPKGRETGSWEEEFDDHQTKDHTMLVNDSQNTYITNDTGQQFRIVDAMGRSGLALNCDSGFRFLQPVNARAEGAAAVHKLQRDQARQEMINDMTRGRDPTPTGVGCQPLTGARAGDVCTINGAPGHLNSNLTCIPDQRNTDARPTYDAVEGQRLKDEAYREMVRDLCSGRRS